MLSKQERLYLTIEEMEIEGKSDDEIYIMLEQLLESFELNYERYEEKEDKECIKWIKKKIKWLHTLQSKETLRALFL